MPKLKSTSIAVSVCAFALMGCSSSVDTSTRNIVTTDAQPVAYNAGGSRAPSAGMTKAYVTGYSFWDNTPPGSAQIARPVVHRRAGGTGTYNDPVTVAVGHAKVNGRSRMDFPAGTRFYFPRLQKYGIVEDLCGDGPRPQNGPCHTGYGGYAWLDIYVGGKSVGAAASDRCMYSITGVQDVIIQPAPGLPVRPGEIALSNCRGA